MTDEIITGLKDLIKDRESFIDKEDKSDKDNIFIKDKEVLEKTIEILQEKDKEIEKYKYLYQKALDNTISTDRENIQLKRQNDLMAGYIATLDIEEDICAKVENENCDKMNFGECERCIKQYFEGKSEIFKYDYNQKSSLDINSNAEL